MGKENIRWPGCKWLALILAVGIGLYVFLQSYAAVLSYSAGKEMNARNIKSLNSEQVALLRGLLPDRHLLPKMTTAGKVDYYYIEESPERHFANQTVRSLVDIHNYGLIEHDWYCDNAPFIITSRGVRAVQDAPAQAEKPGNAPPQ